jgi:peptidylprolyl isomerase domain and WD repeat-containing protein 1
MESKKRRLSPPETQSQPPSKSLIDIPTSSHYSISYMHKQTVTHVTSSPRHGYVLTASSDGVVKFWKRTAAVPPSSGNTGSSSASNNNKEKTSRYLEFVKSYSSHSKPITCLSTSLPNGDSAVSIGYDDVIKFYDVPTFDVSGMIRTSYRLGRNAVLLEKEDLYLLVCVRAGTSYEEKEDEGPTPEKKTVGAGSILLFSGTSLSSEPIRIISYHASPITALAYSSSSWVISADVSGVLEVWSVDNNRDNHNALSSSGQAQQQQQQQQQISPFESKFDTDLYALMKKKTYAIDITASSSHFAAYCSDRKIRLFHIQNQCKMVCIYDERLAVYDNLLSSNTKKSAMGMDAIEYGKRAALEREMEDAHLLSGGVVTNPTTKKSYSAVTSTSEGSYHQSLHCTFDSSGQYLLIPTIVGIKIIHIQTHKVVSTIGKGDASSLRFLHLCHCPGDAKIDQQMQLARMGGSSAAITHGSENERPNDSLLVTLAYGKRRFYAFSHYDPVANSTTNEEEQNMMVLSRDILNEAPDASDLLQAAHMGGRGMGGEHHLDAPINHTTVTKAILRTTHGDISIKLFPKETPRTIENFVGHAQSGYYDNVIFHRIIPGFMVQTGDPLGDGTGGESIWGGEFEDEIRRELRHGEILVEVVVILYFLLSLMCVCTIHHCGSLLISKSLYFSSQQTVRLLSVWPTQGQIRMGRNSSLQLCPLLGWIINTRFSGELLGGWR